MGKKFLLFLSLFLTLLPLQAEKKTWFFEWNKSHSDPTSQGFYNFGGSLVEKDVYTTELNGLWWNIASDGTKKYAYTAKSGQAIGTGMDPSAHTSLWTSGFVGKILAVRITARTNKSQHKADLSIKINDKSLLSDGKTTIALSNQLTEYEFIDANSPEEGKLQINIDPTSEEKSTLFIKKIEVDFEMIASTIPAPEFDPPAGTYDKHQQIKLSVGGAATGQERIFYTTDGSNPKLAQGSRQLYTAPINVLETTSFRAVTLSGDSYSDVTDAKYVIRKDPKLRFNQESISLLTGEDGFADLLNPHDVEPIRFSSSDPMVCSVDNRGSLASSYVAETTTVTITASFSGNEFYQPATATMKVTVVAKKPLATPSISPKGGTYDNPVEVTVRANDDRAITIWYSTKAKDKEEFENDYTKSTIVEGHETTFTIDKSCKLYVMTRAQNVNSEVVTANFVINGSLSAEFTTDHSKTSYYSQNFDAEEGLLDWTTGKGWTLGRKDFSKIDPDDVYSISVKQDGGEGETKLISPQIRIEENSTLEFYAHFSGVFLVYGSWKVNVINLGNNERTQLFDAFQWAQDNAYSGPDWNRFNLDLSSFAGKDIQVEFLYSFGGEDLAIDGFKILREDPSAETAIHLFEGESIQYHSLLTGDEYSYLWSFPGGNIESSTEASPTVTYNKAGEYDVRLTVRRGEGKASSERKGYIIVSQKAPTAIIGLPEEGYESPFVGVFIPTDVPVTFRDLSTGNPTEWKWIFQHTDKTESYEQNPTVTFMDKGTFSVGLTAGNGAGRSNDVLSYAIQAGGAQYAWNISPEENKNINKIALGYYGNYAGTNWLGIDKFAELYKAPLKDAAIDSVAVYFASATSISPDHEIVMTINKVKENGEPGEVIATTKLKTSDLKYDQNDVVPTIFHFPEPINLKKGQKFFITVGSFPNASLDKAPYTTDDISVFCLRRKNGQKNTAWQYVEDQDTNGNGLGTYKWFANTDDPISMAIAPVVTYDRITSDGIGQTTISPAQENKMVKIYNLAGQMVNTPVQNNIYIVKYADGTSKKIVWK